MHLYQIRSLSEYHSLVAKYADELAALKAVEIKLNQLCSDVGEHYMPGFSWPLQSDSEFLIDALYRQDGVLNFRERLVCKHTGLNNRTRAAIHLFQQMLKPKNTDKIYLTEQLTHVYHWLKSKYANSEGSEYLVDRTFFDKAKCQLKMIPHRLKHQDLTHLSYTNEQFKHVLSFDCLEHIPDYQSAMAEVFRVLKPGGQFMFSVPFDPNNANNLIRANYESDGSIKHHVEPEYHGDPISKKGILSFYTFGWQVLDDLLKTGFKDAYATIYWSVEMAYLGGAQVMLFAEK